ncbi:class GN sortase [Shewanella sp. WXL01]|uniref:class GN sortase n=1 Tax=Shewanella sp. WXL01 TaxID=2709721 RepID=UPI00143847A8|nr:class GN sortase [Shewanella sp. WXL01]NKF50496.1 class GN sortase [Shewanella sp. WXL01]
MAKTTIATTHFSARTFHLIITVLLVGGGLMMVFKGGYMQAKAHFAQYLIESAFERSLQDQQAHKPWSWADTHPVAKLTIKRKLSSGHTQTAPLYVLDGASGRTMAFGPGLMHTGAPVSANGNTIITGHRDSHFSVLQLVQVGDEIELIDTSAQVLTYEVSDIQIVHETSTHVLNYNGDTELTLITCYPFEGITSQTEYRYVVSATLKTDTETDGQQIEFASTSTQTSNKKHGYM